MKTKISPSLQEDFSATAGLKPTKTGKKHFLNSIGELSPLSNLPKMLFLVRYWKLSHFQAVDVVLKALDIVYGSEKPTLTSAAMRWMYHHSKLKVPVVHDNYSKLVCQGRICTNIDLKIFCFSRMSMVMESSLACQLWSNCRKTCLLQKRAPWTSEWSLPLMKPGIS